MEEEKICGNAMEQALRLHGPANRRLSYNHFGDKAPLKLFIEALNYENKYLYKYLCWSRQLPIFRRRFFYAVQGVKNLYS